MKISAKTEYACVAMLELAAQHGSGDPVRIRQIAQRHGIPPRFLVQILLQLKAAGLVTSVRGAAGGYHLVGPPEEISLGRIMEVIDTSVKEKEEDYTPNASSDSPAVKALVGAWQEVFAVQREMLGKISLAELVDRIRGQGDGMYYI